MDNRTTHPEATTPDDRFDAVHGIVRSACCYYAAHFRLTRLADDLQAETACRVAALVRENGHPFDRIEVGAETQDSDLRRFIFGIARNVAREFVRAERRTVSDIELSDRATVTMSLESSEPDPADRTALNDAVRGALTQFKSLPDATRTTLVAEEVRKHDYADDASRSLCHACNVSWEKVSTMLNDRNNGVVSDAAWRKRVSRIRDRARTALAGADLFTISLAWIALVAFGVLLSGAKEFDGADADQSMTATTTVDLTLGSTQNGRPKGK
ncbi:MAG: hypothetical protein RIB32_02750 [Phycisphaerales bacterium]